MDTIFRLFGGPQMVKYIMVEYPYDVPRYSRNWFFADILKTGALSTPHALDHVITRSLKRIK